MWLYWWWEGRRLSQWQKPWRGKWGSFEVMYRCLGGLRGPPGSQMVDTDVVVTDEIGFALRMIDMTILGSYYAIIVTIKRAKEKVVVLRVCTAVWGV